MCGCVICYQNSRPNYKALQETLASSKENNSGDAEPAVEHIMETWKDHGGLSSAGRKCGNSKSISTDAMWREVKGLGQSCCVALGMYQWGWSKKGFSLWGRIKIGLNGKRSCGLMSVDWPCSTVWACGGSAMIWGCISCSALGSATLWGQLIILNEFISQFFFLSGFFFYFLDDTTLFQDDKDYPNYV